MPSPDEFHGLEQATTKLCETLDEYTTSFKELESQKMQDENVIKYVKDMEELRASALNSLDTVQKYIITMSGKTEEFARRIKQFGDHISRTAIKYGLSKPNLIPNEVFAEIFTLAAETLEEKVTLSLVCKRFRAVMMSNRKMWDEYCLEIVQTPEQMVAIAEGHRPDSLKAIVHPMHVLRDNATYRSWAIKRGLDPDEYQDRAYESSLELILALRPGELQIVDWNESGETVQQILSRRSIPTTTHSPVMQDLSSVQCSDPFYQNRMVNCMPGAAGSLIRCRIAEIDADQIECLTEFLGSTKLLQDLSVFVDYDAGVELSRPCRALHLPDLQRLEVNFLPRQFISKSLVRLTLHPPAASMTLRDLLEFLSSAKVLQELDVALDRHTVGAPDYQDDSTIVQAVTLPSLVSCKILEEAISTCRAEIPLTWSFLGSLRMPVLQRLKFRRANYRFAVIWMDRIRNNFRTSLQSLSTLQELEVDIQYAGIIGLDEIIRFAPPHLECFSVSGLILVNEFFRFAPSHLDYLSALHKIMDKNKSLEDIPPSPPPTRRVIRFARCEEMEPTFFDIFASYLKDVGLERMKIELDGCEGWRDGTFGLDNIASAWFNA